jgi:membrane-associated phospholipid phosphatase
VIQGRRFWSWFIALGISILVLGCAFWLDPLVRRWIIEHPNPLAKAFMERVSRFGDWPAHVTVGLVLAGLAWWRGSKKWSRIFLSMLIACAIAGVAARVIKITTGRARPSVRTEQTWSGPSLSEKFHAFPSGHVAASMAFFGVLFFANRRIDLWLLAIPLLIAISRMYVAAHYLSDVIFAAMLGLGIAYVVARWAKICSPQEFFR